MESKYFRFRYTVMSDILLIVSFQFPCFVLEKIFENKFKKYQSIFKWKAPKMMVKNYFKKNGFGGADKVPAQKSHLCSN
jgi:hypothetical protein